MKKELIRFHNVNFETRGQKYGSFFFQLFEGELTGILTDDFFEKELLVDLFCGKIQSMNGFLYVQENLVPAEEQIKVIRKISSEEIALISGRPRLFEALSIAENIFFPRFLLKTGKLRKVTQELFHFFQLDFSINKKVHQLSLLERVEIELLHAVVCKRRIIIVSDINKNLGGEDIFLLNKIYKRLVQMGYTICLMESLMDLTMEMLDYFSLIKGGKTVGGGYRGEYSYQEAYMLLNMPGRTEEYQKILKKKDRKYYHDQDTKVLEWSSMSGRSFRNFSFEVCRGEIVEIVCQKHSVYEELKKLLLGEVEPVSGIMSFEEQMMSPREIRGNMKKWKIGVVDAGRNMLFSNKSVMENICYPLSLKIPFFSLRRKYKKASEEYIRDTVKELSLQADAASLSSDQIMWISICKWVLCKPQILLLFVPAGARMDNLDMVTEKLLIELGMYGVSVLLVTEQHEIMSEVIDNELIV